MSIEIRPITPTIGAEVVGIDLTKPIDDQTYAAMREAWLDRTILLIRGQAGMTPAQHIAFTRHFGELEFHTLPQFTLAEHPEIFILSNIVKDGRQIGAVDAGRHWHTDSHYLKEPSSGSILHAKIVPKEGGNTRFANMFAAYDALPEATKKKIDGLKVLVSRINAYPVSYPNRPPLTEEEKARVPDVIHPLVRTHPETGRKALYVGGNVAWEIVDMPTEEGRALLAELREFATQPAFCYEHEWQVGDLIMWDNRSALHCAMGYDASKHQRLMYRTTMAGSAPY
jgi:alpha-ketoglutarate-dependent taurine dioxygenase